MRANRVQQGAPFALALDPEALRPLIAEIVAQVLAQLDADRAKVSGDRLAYSEAEAATLLGLKEHVLRDERRRGQIGASSIAGRRIRYTRRLACLPRRSARSEMNAAPGE